jgi:hypothetical protein
MKGLSEKLKRRFESTHIIREIRPRRRRREDFPLAAPRTSWFPERYFNSFTDDRRPDDNFWLAEQQHYVAAELHANIRWGHARRRKWRRPAWLANTYPLRFGS